MIEDIFYFLGGKIVSHPASKKTGSAELYKEWEFPEQYKHLNHPTWRNLKLEEDWNFIILVIEKIMEVCKKEDNDYYVNILDGIPDKEYTLFNIKGFVEYYNINHSSK